MSEKTTAHSTRAAFFREYRLRPLTERATQPAFVNNTRLDHQSRLVYRIGSRPRLIAEILFGVSGVCVSLFENALTLDQSLRMSRWFKWWLVDTVDSTNWWVMPDEQGDDDGQNENKEAVGG